MICGGEREREREMKNRAYRENTEVRTECYSEIIELHVLSCLCGHSAGLERERHGVCVAVRTLCRCRLSDRVENFSSARYDARVSASSFCLPTSVHSDATRSKRWRL